MAVLVLAFDDFGADLSGPPEAWEQFAAAVEQGESGVEGITVEVMALEQVRTRREGSRLIIEASADHLRLLGGMARGLAEAGRAAGPNPSVVRHCEIEPEPYLSWVASDALPVHLVCESPPAR